MTTIIIILGVVLGFTILKMCEKALPTNEEEFFKNHGITLEEYKKRLTNKK